MSLTIEQKLKAMKLPRMKEEYLKQKEDPGSMNLSFEERFKQMVDLEYDARISNTIGKLIRKADFYDSSASLEEINYKPSRKLDKGQIDSLSDNSYIANHLNIILVGVTGSGKTWLSCAFGVNACKARYRVKYIRLPDLFSEFEAKKIQGRYREYIKELKKYDLLILDEFLLVTASASERNDLLELMEARINRKSTIFALPNGFRKDGTKDLAAVLWLTPYWTASSILPIPFFYMEIR